MNGGEDPYDGWAWLYDRTMGPAYCREQIAVLERVLLPEVEVGAHLFDLCCGTGQLVQPLVDAGYLVTGLDGSEQMLARARVNAPTSDFILGDARSYSAAESFDAAFSTSASLNHLSPLEDLRVVFQNVFRSLRSGSLFVFDLNHHGQMKKWWRGRSLEGEISDGCAWSVTPSYDPDRREGAFRVNLFCRPADRAPGLFDRLKSAGYRILSRERFIGIRLKLIERFHLAEPGWNHRQLDFPVVSHELDEVRAAVLSAGFSKVEVQTLTGNPVIDDDHSAYFICWKGEGA
ncbi:MAG: methyltransferase domain-containing protein [Verrucomicrobiota bacterium]